LIVYQYPFGGKLVSLCDESLPLNVLLAAKGMLADSKADLPGGSTVVAGYWIETHTLGCRNAADEEESTWWHGLWEFYDRYDTDGVSVVLGDPTDGKFVTITPQNS
jgi:hypothetical protein